MHLILCCVYLFEYFPVNKNVKLIQCLIIVYYISSSSSKCAYIQYVNDRETQNKFKKIKVKSSADKHK